jgi:Ca2+-binding EF-hand superfamily protein
LSQISNEAEFENNEIDELIKYFDINENGKIEFTNFWDLMNKTI